MGKIEQHHKVFGIGLSRTGTTSLSKALNILGIKTKHYPSDKRTFEELRKGNYRLSVLERYQGIVDIPAAAYHAQFDKTYPESKFIFTVRELSSWLKSVEERWRIGQERFTTSKFAEFIQTCVYGTLEFNEDRLRYVYETHFRNVREYFADRPDDLLVMNICDGDGWEKLCPFLRLPIPDISFPHMNSGEENRKWLQRFDLALQDIPKIIPRGSAFILIDYWKTGYRFNGDRYVIPFNERDGLYYGPPPDDITAIRELTRLRRAGANFIVFLWPYFWWLDYYSGLNRHLRSEYSCVIENEKLIVFEMRS